MYLNQCWDIVNTLRRKQNGRHFTDNTLKFIFVNENVRILIKISLKFVPTVRINNIPVLAQIMACRRPGDKPLSEPWWVPTHIWVTRPQWVNWAFRNKLQGNFNLNSNISFKKMHMKMASGKWHPFCLGLNVLKWFHAYSAPSHYVNECWLIGSFKWTPLLAGWSFVYFSSTHIIRNFFCFLEKETVDQTIQKKW